ncbi:hypothetical protein SAMN04487897_101222 [Paenibacillus sp. yr247]|uniref:hypothetical protein n=1 Tax=Paenibacillus sp. yr247 TaxID=1761880 RepID=UPI000886F04F|nr:hypothetical protein [Paenibacillus sp. yr247]SDM84140.1 hypothetical protein SAMN04487897_101222 [Paenibacillus sp. yr247]
MDPFREMKQKDTAAGFISVGLTIITSVLGILNWFELRSLLLACLAFFNVKASSWQGIDNFTFLLMGVGWLAYVFYGQHFLKKKAAAKQVLQAAAMLFAFQLGLLFVCNLLSHVLLKVAFESYMMLFLVIEGTAALLFSLFAVKAARGRALQ